MVVCETISDLRAQLIVCQRGGARGEVEGGERAGSHSCPGYIPASPRPVPHASIRLGSGLQLCSSTLLTMGSTIAPMQLPSREDDDMRFIHGR